MPANIEMNPKSNVKIILQIVNYVALWVMCIIFNIYISHIVLVYILRDTSPSIYTAMVWDIPKGQTDEKIKEFFEKKMKKKNIIVDINRAYKIQEWYDLTRKDEQLVKKIQEITQKREEEALKPKTKKKCCSCFNKIIEPRIVNTDS